MVNNVTAIQSHEHPNAVCAICRKNGKLERAAALRQFGLWIQFYVCAGHAERARRWDEVCASSARYRARRVEAVA